jgi:Tfp pilus tip-associated adhesin PilY1
MDPFYKTVVIVAIVMLILALIGLGVLMQEQDTKTEYPPQQSTCPDHWSSTGDNQCKINENSGGTGLNVGNFDKTDGDSDDYMSYTVNGSDKLVTFESSLLVCDKKKWANKYNIVWDGVSNYNQC